MIENSRASVSDRASMTDIITRMEDDVLAIRDFAEVIDQLTQGAESISFNISSINRLAGEVLKRAAALQQSHERVLSRPVRS